MQERERERGHFKENKDEGVKRNGRKTIKKIFARVYALRVYKKKNTVCAMIKKAHTHKHDII